jgi:hypothetical protein
MASCGVGAFSELDDLPNILLKMLILLRIKQTNLSSKIKDVLDPKSKKNFKKLIHNKRILF